MNFLAHLYLSGSEEDLIIGNFIADSVRSSQWNQFKPGVVKGIQLHHKIDAFTDSHPVVEESKERLRAVHHKYSGVIVDILYDHFLARDFDNYSGVKLADFASNSYRLFHSRWDELPTAIQRMLPFMEKHNWLVNYGNRDGLQKVFNGMSRRASFQNQMDQSVNHLFDDYELFEKEFRTYFTLLQEYVQKEIDLL